MRASLRICVALMCWGLAAERLSSGVESAATALLVSQGWLVEDFSAQCSDWTAYALIACGFLTLLRPCWPVLLPVAAWTGARAAAAAVIDEDPIRTLDHSVLVIAPLVLSVVDFWPPSLRFSLGRTQFSLGLLRVAITVSLFAQAGLFVREIGDAGGLTASLRTAILQVAGTEPDDSLVFRVLAVASAVNAGLGLVVLTSRQRGIVLCTAAWSCALATIPVVVDGPAGVSSLMIDAPRVGAALALAWFWLLAVKEQPPTIMPAI